MNVVRWAEITPEVIAPGRKRYLAYTDDLMVVVIDFEDGPHAEPDPPHSHPHQQVTYVAEGEVVFFLGDEPHTLGPGDLITVPGDLPHTIQLRTERARLVDTFTPIREEFLRG
jgi:quercetin dioxygenase-like cupin family protein